MERNRKRNQKQRQMDENNKREEREKRISKRNSNTDYPGKFGQTSGGCPGLGPATATLCMCTGDTRQVMSSPGSSATSSSDTRGSGGLCEINICVQSTETCLEQSQYSINDWAMAAPVVTFRKTSILPAWWFPRGLWEDQPLRWDRVGTKVRGWSFTLQLNILQFPWFRTKMCAAFGIPRSGF